MQIARPNLRTPARRAVGAIAAAPLMAALALASIVITLVVALGTVSAGRLPATGSIGLVCALVLAAVAVAEASRPARSERARRRVAPPPASRQELSDVDASIVTRWH
ncbi:MAG: hypothetical protein JO304_24000 [Solirubrobacterales bacterium]|nr:hypothetical protein [Solirubrobacterales bacterium]